MSAQILQFPVVARSDHDLELQINAAHQRLLLAKSADSQYAAWQEMKRLCCMRSKEQIERMERAKGLR